MDKHGQIDMLHGPIWNKLPRFALPIAATAILEQLFNASDVAVVGNFTGVCTQPYQWQGYSQSVQYSSDTYTLARSVLRRWYDGETGNIPAGSVFMEVTEHGLKYRRLFRDTESVKIYFDGYGTPPDKALHST